MRQRAARRFEISFGRQHRRADLQGGIFNAIVWRRKIYVFPASSS